jgi:transcriptional regulator with GAF, ATPase, and Fis domain
VAVTEPSPPDGLIGRSRGMLSVYKQIARALASEAPVLITGETGTGKELVAHAIHRNGRRAEWPFVAFNCGALAEGILESELFGHVRGSFTGAVADKKGLFEQAHGGTLFLDEIGETSPAVQVKLLRVLEEGEVRPVGGSRPMTVNVRVIAATNRDLDRAVAEGIFRRDLFFRLNVFPIPVPPLRERRDDIPLLVGHFLRLVGERSGKSASLSPEAMAALQAYRWPGNVRELENAVERLVLEGAGGSIDAGDLPAAMRARAASLKERLFEDLPSLQEIEKRYLIHVLGVMKGNRSRAAEVLGIDRRTLYRMAERFGIELPDDK